MEIKGIHEIYKVHSPAMGNPPATRMDESQQKNKPEANGFDVINISSKASFQTKLNTEVKKYTASAQVDTSASDSRIAALKVKYQGDNCPVSGMETAGAMLNKICGVN